MENITFEKLTDNIDEAVEIYNYYMLNTTACYSMKALTKDEFTDYYHVYDPHTKSFAVKVDGDVAGFILLKPWNLAKEAYRQTYEFTIYLKKEYCKMGLGTKAFQYMEEQIKYDDIAVIMAGLSCDNVASAKLMESQGFEKCGHFKKMGKKFGKYLDLCYYQKLYPDKFEEETECCKCCYK